MTTQTNRTVAVNTDLQHYMLQLVCQLRWKHALDACLRDGRDYTEIHFWRDLETDEFVLTYWEIKP